MQIKVFKDAPFKAVGHSFAVAPTTSGYTLEYSADKTNWTAYDEETPAAENLMVLNVVRYMWFRLNGNTDAETTVIL